MAGDLPDAKSPDLGGAYAHALKSVVVGPDKSVYVSVGSTANISPQDRDANPQRASILRIPPGGGAPEVFARGVRNGTGLAVAPDGRIWTAVNNRDNIQYPYHQAYGGDGDAFGQVIPQYVNDHPPEELAALTPGRDLGWPFCNPEPDTQPGVAGTPLKHADLGFTRDVETNADGSKLDCSKLAPIEQTFGAHSAPLGLTFATLPAPFGAGARRRGARVVEPDRAAGPGGVVLPVREREDGRPADRRRRVPGGRRLALGPPGRGGARSGRGALRQRRPGRRDLPGDAAREVTGHRTDERLVRHHRW